MNFDELLEDAWQSEARPAAPDLIRRVHRRRTRYRVQRVAEIALTLVAVLVFGQALASGSAAPSHWLLMPFYLVFLPMVWTIVLRTPRRRAEDLTERVGTYAHLRLSQLRTSLRDLWLARAATGALLAYALLANAGVWALADADWRSAGLQLLILASAGLVVSLRLRHTLRRRWLREYGAVLRMTRD
jgi:hypothetical protein